MTFADDLLDQAFHLAKKEAKKPKQASLRRAVSAAYYAMFHMLASDGAKLLSPRLPAGLPLRVQRAFGHADMRNICQKITDPKNGSNGKIIPASTRNLLGFPLESELVAVLGVFVALQEARHEADYDSARKWNRLETLSLAEDAKAAFADWEKVKKEPNATVVLAAMLLQKSWK